MTRHCHVHHVCVGHPRPVHTWTLPCTCPPGSGLTEEQAR